MLALRCVYVVTQEMLLSCKANHVEPGSMKRAMPEENSEAKRNFFKHESINFGYDASSYANYSSPSSSTPSTIAQPLPGQPPLPPMPPPSGVPPPPHVFGPVPSQVAPIQWTHTPPWQWIAQASPLPPPTPHDIANTIQREIPLRGNYIRRERFHNRNNMYVQRNNFHRKSRKMVRFGQPQGQFDQAAYFGATLTGNLGLEWRRNNYPMATNDAIINHLTVPQSLNHSIPPITPGIVSNRHIEETEDQDVKIEKVVKKNKSRKPMSQSYPSKPWNREDAERALKIESEYNMKNKVNAQSLIIKFPDTDLNKEIVSTFHSDILNIHFQNPCGPRYCFIQMAEDVNIDEAIKELEKIKFGLGYLKVEKKLLRDEDNPEEIDPYTLFIGNLPESVKTSEIKSKFPKAQDEETRKMKNTRNILMRYNSVDDAISDYKQAYGLMWDKRSINVRFRRKRGNTCPSEEPKLDVKKVKMEPNNAAQVEKGRSTNHVELELDVNELKEEESNTETKEDKVIHTDKSLANQNVDSAEARLQDNSNKAQRKPTSQAQENINSHLTGLSTQEEQPWTLQSHQIPSTSEDLSSCSQTDAAEEMVMLTQIKEEPKSDDDDDDDDDEDGDDDDDDSDDDEDDVEEPGDSNDDNVEEDSEYNNEDENIDDDGNISFRAEPSGTTRITRDNEGLSDHLDQMFSELENTTSDISF